MWVLLVFDSACLSVFRVGHFASLPALHWLNLITWLVHPSCSQLFLRPTTIRVFDQVTWCAERESDGISAHSRVLPTLDNYPELVELLPLVEISDLLIIILRESGRWPNCSIWTRSPTRFKPGLRSNRHSEPKLMFWLIHHLQISETLIYNTLHWLSKKVVSKNFLLLQFVCMHLVYLNIFNIF